MPTSTSTSTSTEETTSTHRAEIVPISLLPHPNPKAKALSIVKVFGYTVVVRTKDWKSYITDCNATDEVPVAVFIQPDSIVPEMKDPPWAYLGKAIKGEDGVTVGFEPLTETERRIKTRRFMGVYSEGILIPVPLDARLKWFRSSEVDANMVGIDLANFLGITHYEPQEKNHHFNFLSSSAKIEQAKSPGIKVPVYSLENWYRYGNEVFSEGQQVVITEKIHGTNARFVFSSRDKEFFIGSHRTWKTRTYELPYQSRWHRVLRYFKLKEPKLLQSTHVWARVALNHPWILGLCSSYPDYVVYGEIYGDVQNLKYGCKENEIKFRVFDIYNAKDEKYLSYDYSRHLCSIFGLETVPELYVGPYSEAKVRELIDGNSKAVVERQDGTVTYTNTQIREGIVIQSMNDDGNMGGARRAKLKAVSSQYLEREK